MRDDRARADALRRRAGRDALACGVVAVGAPPPPSAEAAPSGGNGLQTPDYRIETSETHWNFNSGDFTMPHRVKFYRPGTDAISDRASGNSKKGTASLYGSVVVHDSGNTAVSVGKGAYNGSGPATLTCDQLDVDSRAKLYVATGHVHFSQGTRSGSASKAILNRANGTLHLEGDVHLSDNGSTLSANAVDYNLNTKDVQVVGAPAVMSQPEHAPRRPVRRRRARRSRRRRSRRRRSRRQNERGRETADSRRRDRRRIVPRRRRDRRRRLALPRRRRAPPHGRPPRRRRVPPRARAPSPSPAASATP